MTTPAPPPRWQLAYVIACCAIIGGTLAYCISDFADWPKLTLAPLTGAATVAAKSSSGGITYWGLLSWGGGGAAVGGAIGVVLARWITLRRNALQLLGGWAVAALMLGSLYFFTLIAVVTKLVSDILYRVVDPRVQFGSVSK